MPKIIQNVHKIHHLMKLMVVQNIFMSKDVMITVHMVLILLKQIHVKLQLKKSVEQVNNIY